jgi:hypothetical protein
LNDEIFSNIPTSVLERLRVETAARIAKSKGNLANAFFVVVPRIASTQESHNDAGAFRNGAGCLYVG